MIAEVIEQSRSDISITRIGLVAIGADIEYADGITIARAMEEKKDDGVMRLWCSKDVLTSEYCSATMNSIYAHHKARIK